MCFKQKPELATIGFELSCQAIPMERVIEILDFLPYASQMRLAWSWLFLTGMRMSEMDRFNLNGQASFLKGNYAFWRCGKNQHGQWRKEYIPDAWLAEYAIYRQNNRVYANNLFSASSDTLSRQFNAYWRKELTPGWFERAAVVQHGGIHEFILQMKGLRKSFATLVFWNAWQKYKDTNVAMEMTAKRMRHSSNGMTVQHYISNSDKLNRERWEGYTPSEVIALSKQRHISEFSMNTENRQSRIVDFMI